MRIFSISDNNKEHILIELLIILRHKEAILILDSLFLYFAMRFSMYSRFKSANKNLRIHLMKLHILSFVVLNTYDIQLK